MWVRVQLQSLGNEIADKITSIGKTKNEEDATNEIEEIYMPPVKRNEIIDDLSLF